MNVTIAKQELNNALQAIKGVQSARTTIPILSNVLLQADKGLACTTTNLDMSIRVTVEASVEEVGTVTLPLRQLTAIARDLPDAPITLTSKEPDCTTKVDCEATHYKLLGMDAAEFPAFAIPEVTMQYQIPQKALRAVLSRTLFAASMDSSRYVLNGVFLQMEKEKLTAAATDGRRLALHEVGDIVTPTESSLILPIITAQALLPLLNDTDEDLTLGIAKNQFTISGAKMVLYSKIVEGTFPNYKQVIPTNNSMHVTINRARLVQALHRVSLVLTEREDHVTVSLAENKISVRANTAEHGEAKDSWEIEYTHKPLEIAINAKYLLEPLTISNAETVQLELKDSDSSVAIRDGNTLSVVMPVRAH